MYRLFAIGVVLLWLGAMSALLVRDVWPAWTAQDPPPMTVEQFSRLHRERQQFGMYDARGNRLGTSWSEVVTTRSITSIHGTILLEGLKLIPTVIRIETITEFDKQGALDSFGLDIYGVPETEIYIRGERRGIYFPCELKLGTVNLQANLNLSASRMIGQTFTPFAFLPELKVGQSWRMQFLNPLSAVLSKRTHFISVVARVTGTEAIEHLGKQVECFIVQTHPTQAKAWVDKNGRVLMQEADIPMLGKVVIREENFNEQAWQAARYDY
ncbi:MAG: hypothetical protein JSV03_00380 [Planctomycetota bacterium]|nr:MAG: hypothetical protein JSV03_00380 [Planctomycetota bacterium]